MSDDWPRCSLCNLPLLGDLEKHLGRCVDHEKKEKSPATPANFPTSKDPGTAELS